MTHESHVILYRPISIPRASLWNWSSKNESTEVAYLVLALCYKPEGRGFDPRCHWIFQLTQSFQPHYGSGVDSASNINEYQESSWGVKGGQPARKADNLTAICEPRRLTTVWASTACYRDSFAFSFFYLTRKRHSSVRVTALTLLCLVHERPRTLFPGNVMSHLQLLYRSSVTETG
jgi:hypothetical protein